MNKSNFSMLRSPDPLDTDCSGIDTSFPLLQPESLHRFTIKVQGKKPASKDAGKDVIALKCGINKDAVGTKKEPIRAGFPVFHYLTIDTRTPEATEKTIKGIAQIVKGCGIKATPRQVIDSDGMVLDGKVFDSTVKVNPAKDGYSESNSLGTIVPVAG